MIDLVLTCVFISMAICGLWLSTEEGMLLRPLVDYYDYKVAKYGYPRFWIWLQKPLFDCVTCMASIWGTIGWFTVSLLDGFQYTDIILWPIAILAIAFLNTILIRLT